MTETARLKDYSISGAQGIFPGKRNGEAVRLHVKDRIISGSAEKSAHDMDLKGRYFVYPALINIHDHLRGDYLPRVGPQEGEFYLNWAPWDKDLKASPVYGERANISIEDAYLLGAYKNLFSGVVTVNDHFPHEFNQPFLGKMPIRVIEDYALAHECSSFDLKWGDGIKTEHSRAKKRSHPFITHLEEGYDIESQRGIDILEKLNCLDEYDVFIHCIGFSDEDILKVKKAGAHIAWCPASNVFMFNFTCKIRKIIERGINVSIGTDSTHTGSVNLLEEMRYARDIYRMMYGEDLPAKKIFEMVTVNPARAFRIQDRLGTLEAGKLADLLIVEKKHDDPCESLLLAGMNDIAFMSREGVPLYGKKEFGSLFEMYGVKASTVKVKGREMYVAGDPAGLMRRIHSLVGFRKILDFMPFSV